MNLKLPFLLLFNGFVSYCIAQNTGIGTNTPDPSAMLEVRSTNAGKLVPRMTWVPMHQQISLR